MVHKEFYLHAIGLPKITLVKIPENMATPQSYERIGHNVKGLTVTAFWMDGQKGFAA